MREWRMFTLLERFFGLFQKNLAINGATKNEKIQKTSTGLKTRYAQTYNFLNRALFENASRHGTSAFRLGFIPQSVSDHLPIAASIETEKKTAISLISWNLLADTHLYNNFMNVTGTCEFFDAIQQNFHENIYCTPGSAKQNKLYHYFSELARFLYENLDVNTVTISPELLEKFSDITYFDQYPSHLARSRNPTVVERKKISVLDARRKMGAILLDTSHPNHHEFRLAIQHSLELYHHIEYGALRWENRFPIIQNNQSLIEQLRNTDFLCFQECTAPEDFKKIELPHTMITHRINQTTNDHCVLAYDEKKFRLIDTVTGALSGHKPFIIGKFQNIITDEFIILGSIHYPGDNHRYTNEILEAIEALKTSPNEKKIDFFVAGDYNHTQEFFQQEECLRMHYPQLGTMAGSDYGNINNAIDAILTGYENSSSLCVERIRNLPIAVPADSIPFKVHFLENNQLSEQASPSFWKPVQREVSQQTAEESHISEAFPASSATLSSRPSI